MAKKSKRMASYDAINVRPTNMNIASGMSYEKLTSTLDVTEKINVARNLLSNNNIPYDHPGHLTTKTRSGFLAQLLVLIRKNGLYNDYVNIVSV